VDVVADLANCWCNTIMGIQSSLFKGRTPSGSSTLTLLRPQPSHAQARIVGTAPPFFHKEQRSVPIQTSTLDCVVASTMINDAPPSKPYYQTGQVPRFTGPMLNQNGGFEVDNTITNIPQTTVPFACDGKPSEAKLRNNMSLRPSS